MMFTYLFYLWRSLLKTLITQIDTYFNQVLSSGKLNFYNFLKNSGVFTFTICQFFLSTDGQGAEYYWQTMIGSRHYQSSPLGGHQEFKSNGRQTSLSLHSDLINQEYLLAGAGYTFLDLNPEDWSGQAHKVQQRSPFIDIIIQPKGTEHSSAFLRLRWSKFGHIHYSYDEVQKTAQTTAPERTFTETRTLFLGYRYQLVPIASLLFEISRGIEYTIHDSSELSGKINLFGLYIGVNVRIQGRESTSL